MKGLRYRELLLALFVQAVLAAVTEDPWDLEVWRVIGRGMADSSLYSISHEYPYAYPPLWGWWCYLAHVITVGLAASPWLGRLTLKAPIIVGNILLAWYLSRQMARDDRASAAVSPRLLLWHPLLILSGTCYGMFDVWITLTLVAAVLLLTRGRLVAAAALWAVSSNLKGFFPAFLLPLFVAHVWWKRGRRPAALFCVLAVGFLLAPNLYYLITEPRGFLAAVGHHGATKVNGLALWAFFTQALGTSEPHLLAVNLLMGVTTLAALAAAVLLDCRSRRAGFGSLGGAVLLATVGLLLFSRVVNEQYYVWALGPLFLLTARGPIFRRYFYLTALIPSVHLLLHFGPDLLSPLTGVGDYWTGRYFNPYPLMGGIALLMFAVNCVLLTALVRAGLRSRGSPGEGPRQ